MTLSRGQLITYGFPALSLTALGLPVYVTLPTFYADTIGLGLEATGAALLTARLADALVDPIVGRMCDGMSAARFKVLVMLGLPLISWAGWHLFVPGLGVQQRDLILWSILFYAGLTLIVVPYQAWGAALSPDYSERTRIAAWREGLGIVGMVFAFCALSLFPIDLDRGLSALFLPAIVALWISVLVALVRVPSGATPRRALAPPMDAFTGMWRNLPFRQLVLSQGLNALANALPATLFLMFVEDRLHRPGQAGWLLLVYFLFAIVAMPFWMRIASKLGKHRTWKLSLFATSVAFLPAFLVGPDDIVLFAGICAMTGVGLAADLCLPSAILADVIDEHTAQSGGAHAGFYTSIWVLLAKLALAVSVGVAFPLLSWAGFKQGEAHSPEVQSLLVVLYAGVPIALKITAALGLSLFSLDQLRQQTLQRQIVLIPEA
jgi:Na+/melibiose symporter-like transporter